MTANMYRVGDYVYFETSPTSPFQIRRIEELNKTPSGNVEAKVMCFYRRRDLPNSLVQLADKHQMATAEDSPVAMKLKKMWLKTPVGEEQAAQAVLDPAIAALDEEKGSGEKNEKGETLLPKQRHQMKHRELFLSRQVETLQATHIRGKCSVTLLNETESLLSYLNKDDTFFYCLVFDPTQKTLLADKGEIRVGTKYQTDMQRFLKEDEIDDRKSEDLETLVWTPEHVLTDRKIDQFLVVSRSVGTFARALDCSSSVKQPSLHMSAAAASRDITLFHAMDTLHKHNYSIEEAMCSLVPSSGPVLCRDEMEEWSASEANLFEEALDKYGKDFNDIRTDYLPWKTLKNIVEYYYMWKTTDRYVQQKRVKAVEAESKLKQVYIPNYTKPNSNAVVTNMKGSSSGGIIDGRGGAGITNGNSNGNGNLGGVPNDVGKMCESCSAGTSSQWYTWGPSHLNCRLCHTCWQYWKKYGGLKIASRIADTDNVELVKKRANQVVNNVAGIPGALAGPGGMNNNNDMMDDDRMTDLSNRQVQRCSIVNCGKEFKLKTHLARHYAQAHGIAIRSGSPRPIMKTRTAFFLQTTLQTKLSRKLCRHLIKPRKAARQPTYAINTQAVKMEFAASVSTKSPVEMKALLVYKKRDRGSVTQIANKLGTPSTGSNEWLILTPKDKMPKPEVVAFPKPPKAPDGSLMYERIPNKDSPVTVAGAPAAVTTVVGATTATGGAGGGGSGAVANSEKGPVPMNVSTSTSLKRRYNDDVNGLDRPPTKRPNKDPAPSHRPTQEQYQAMMAAAVAAGQPLPRHHLNGKPKIAQMSRTSSGRKQVISWMDAPDDVYFRASDASKKARRTLSIVDLRRSARKPWRNLNIKSIPPALMVTTSTAASSTPSASATNLPTSNSGSGSTAAAAAVAASISPLALPPGLSIASVSSPVTPSTDKSPASTVAGTTNPSDAASAQSSSGGGSGSGGGGGGGGSTGVAVPPVVTPVNNSDLQVVILD